jgi:ankyrin repeat protein
LLELGAETKPKDFDGRQAMHMAAMHGEDFIIKALCEKQATVNTK